MHLCPLPRVNLTLSKFAAAPEEYFIDRVLGELYFLPKTPLSAGSDVMISHLSSVVSSQNTSHVSFESMVISDARGDVMSVTSASNLLIKNTTIKNGFGDCLVVSGTNLTLMGNTVVGCGASGISVASGDIKRLVGGHTVVANNTITNVTRIVRVAPGGQAIKLSGVGVQLLNNVLTHTPHTAIYSSGNDHMIEHNLLRDVCYECNDCGALYSARSWAQRGKQAFLCKIHSVLAYICGISHREIMGRQYSALQPLSTGEGERAVD
jgi:hypothetical protein